MAKRGRKKLPRISIRMGKRAAPHEIERSAFFFLERAGRAQKKHGVVLETLATSKKRSYVKGTDRLDRLLGERGLYSSSQLHKLREAGFTTTQLIKAGLITPSPITTRQITKSQQRAFLQTLKETQAVTVVQIARGWRLHVDPRKADKLYKELGLKRKEGNERVRIRLRGLIQKGLGIRQLIEEGIIREEPRSPRRRKLYTIKGETHLLTSMGIQFIKDIEKHPNIFHIDRGGQLCGGTRFAELTNSNLRTVQNRITRLIESGQVTPQEIVELNTKRKPKTKKETTRPLTEQLTKALQDYPNTLYLSKAGRLRGLPQLARLMNVKQNQLKDLVTSLRYFEGVSNEQIIQLNHPQKAPKKEILPKPEFETGLSPHLTEITQRLNQLNRSYQEYREHGDPRKAYHLNPQETRTIQQITRDHFIELQEIGTKETLNAITTAGELEQNIQKGLIKQPTPGEQKRRQQTRNQIRDLTIQKILEKTPDIRDYAIELKTGHPLQGPQKVDIKEAINIHVNNIAEYSVRTIAAKQGTELTPTEIQRIIHDSTQKALAQIRKKIKL